MIPELTAKPCQLTVDEKTVAAETSYTTARDSTAGSSGERDISLILEVCDGCSEVSAVSDRAGVVGGRAGAATA